MCSGGTKTMARPYDINITKEIRELVEANYCIFTHSGSIHKDDVTACAVAAMLYDSNKPIKMRRVSNDELKELGLNDANALVLDIGKGRFDHHFDSRNAEEAELIRYYPAEEGKMPVEMSAVARFWDYCGTNVVHEQVITMLGEADDELCFKTAQIIEDIYIKPISDTDTKGQVARPNLLSANVSRRSIMASMILDKTKADASTKTRVMDGVFKELVLETIKELQAYIYTEYSSLDQIKRLEEFKQKCGGRKWVNTTVEFGEFVSANKFAGTTIKFVVSESNRTAGEWNLLAVDAVVDPIPKSVKDVAGFKFLHDKRFIASFTSKEAAEEAASRI